MSTVPLPLTVYYDQSCALCRDEMHFLVARGGPEKIRLVDASAADFVNDTGVPVEELLARIYGRDANGQLTSGMALLRNVYSAAGLGWVLAATGLPGLAPVFDRLYLVVAQNRYRLPTWVSRRIFSSSCRDGICQR